ncbi:MAG: glycosyltransferase family 39 protein [Aggregatilineales bacterium]
MKLGRPHFILMTTAVLLLAAATRIGGVGSWPVWTDEGWSVWAASAPSLGETIQRVAEDRHPPLYFAALHLWGGLAGESRLALRFLSIGAGLLTVAAVYRIGADAFGRRAGVLGALLLAVLPTAVYYGQEIRHYGWLMLFTTLLWLFALRYLRRPRFSTWLGAALSLTLILYTLYIGLLVVGALAVAVIIYPVPVKRKLALGMAGLAAGALYIPWLIVIAEQAAFISRGISGFPGTIPTTLASLPLLLSLIFGVGWALTLGAYGYALLPDARPAPRRRDLIALATGGAGLFLVMFVLSLRFDLLAARTLSFLTPLLMIVSGAGLNRLGGRASVLLALTFAIATLSTPFVVQTRLPIDRLTALMAPQASPGDLVVIETGWDDNAFAYELRLALPEGTELIPTLPWTNDLTGGILVVPQIEERLARAERVWTVNWLQAPEALPFLAERGGLGFLPILSFEIDAGEHGARLGDPTLRAALFGRPEPFDPVIFDERIALRGVVAAPTAQPGRSLLVDLWWAALAPLDRDYSAGVFLLGEDGVVLAEAHGPLAAAPSTTWPTDDLAASRWRIDLPAGLPAGRYPIGIVVYWYADPVPLSASGAPLAGPVALIAEVRVEP